MTAADLQALLDAHQLKPMDLARRMGVRAEAIWRWRTGKRDISLKASQRILEALGKTVCPTCGQTTQPVEEESDT